MSKLLIVIIALFALTIGGAQAQQTATPTTATEVPMKAGIAVDRLIGKFSGYHLQLGKEVGTVLTISGTDGNKVSGSFYMNQGPRGSCGGSLAATGEFAEPVLNLVIESPSIVGCTERKIRLTVSKNGDTLVLDGTMIDTDGRPRKIHLEK